MIYHIFSFVKSNNFCGSDVLLIKLISFIVLTKFFNFIELKILRQPGAHFLKLKTLTLTLVSVNKKFF